MKSLPFTATAAALLFSIVSTGCSTGSSEGVLLRTTLAAEGQPKKTLHPFKSEQELRTYLRKRAEELRRERRETASKFALALPSMTVDPGKDADKSESITNTQHADVDEGAIVKIHGNHLVILRRGRIFTVSLTDGGLEPICSVDAFSPDVDPHNTWYDEMLISGDTIVVIGYSYERGGTEASLLHINSAGELAYQSTYQLRSNDYYSSRNYASRLIGAKLIFYSPLYLDWYADPAASLPAVRKWHKGAKPGDFRRIVSATNVYHGEVAGSSGEDTALHTVTTCDLSGGDFDCKAISVFGPSGRVFYVSPNSVYVWATEWAYPSRENARPKAQSILYRMPLDGAAPTALRVSGSPVDQFSFLESEDGQLNVLVRSEAAGDGMWRAEVAEGEVALMRVPLSSFSDGTATVASSDYLPLSKVQGYFFQNRFVGDYLLYGSGSGWGHPRKTSNSPLHLVRRTDGASFRLALAHGTDRIEQMGSNAVVVGTDGKNLHFTSVRLGNSPEIAGSYIRKDASQGELRSQGFFYKPASEDSGTLGLPISYPARPGYRHLFESSAAILFLHNLDGDLSEVGELASRPDLAVDDKCRASCVDWYGNARPLFVRNRVIALLGYELVEGQLAGNHVSELGRINYAPSSTKTAAAEPSK
jgi:Beta propeller domain